MKSWFLESSYPEHLIDTEMKKVKFKPKEKTKKSKSKGVPFVVNYHLSLNFLHKIVRHNTYLLYMNEGVKNLFLPEPMVWFRGACKLSSCLVRATGESFKINHQLNWWQMYHISPNMQTMSETIYWGNYGWF